MSSTFTDAFDQVHPDLVDLLIRLDLLPTEEGNGFSEPILARTIFLAMELADPDEQALLVSRIISEAEMAAERLRSPAVQDTSHRIVLDREERKAAFLKDPFEPERISNGEDCIVCTESAHIQAPCGCNYCSSCFREALRIGLRCQEEFPPRCCQPFDEEAVALAGSPALVHLFRQIQEEAEVPIPDRLYCHSGTCAAFIPPDRKGHCLICICVTCIECGARAHDGQPCVEEDVEEDVWATMDANRTVNCPTCGRMIQLAEACNHMTCPCGYQFCYLCGQRWKACGCPQHAGFERMVPMRNRPGVRPPRFRRRPHRTEASTSQGDGSATLRIPQLRPNPGEEEERAPRSDTHTFRRVIRPLVLPQHEEAGREQQLEEHHKAEIRRWREEEDERMERDQVLQMNLPARVPNHLLRPPAAFPFAYQGHIPQRREAPRPQAQRPPPEIHQRAPQIVPGIPQAPVRNHHHRDVQGVDGHLIYENPVGGFLYPHGLTANPAPMLDRSGRIEEQRLLDGGGGGIATAHPLYRIPSPLSGGAAGFESWEEYLAWLSRVYGGLRGPPGGPPGELRQDFLSEDGRDDQGAQTDRHHRRRHGHHHGHHNHRR